MPSENAPNLNIAETDEATSEIREGVGVSENGQKEITTETGREAEIKERETLTTEEQLEILGSGIETHRLEIERLENLVGETKSQINQARKKLGFPPTEEDPQSVFAEKEKLKELRSEQENLEKQREKLVSQQEKERLIEEEKNKILQEKFDELSEELGALDPGEMESILGSGKTSRGENFESKSLGTISPQAAQALAEAFTEGMKLLPEILKNMPELLKQFEKLDEELTREATERVEKKLEEEKAKAGREEEVQVNEEEKVNTDETVTPVGAVDEVAGNGAPQNGSRDARDL